MGTCSLLTSDPNGCIVFGMNGMSYADAWIVRSANSRREMNLTSSTPSRKTKNPTSTNDTPSPNSSRSWPSALLLHT